MNPFRSRKKSFAEADVGKTRPSMDNAPAVPAIPSNRGMTFRKKKSAQPEPKPELNLKDALPSTDDFRTSLLMPNLSARFSMLREQDDPNSKIGKANDDSVLFPRRQSRLGLFSPEGLSDIAEVSSLAGSIRPPFANERTHSFGSLGEDGYGTDDGSTNGSIMSRAKPGQGNKFFGGRQVVYKVPASNLSKKEQSTEEGNRRLGKAVYNDDISMSTFQKLREDRKAAERESLERERNSRENDRSDSPPFASYNRNRETSSSTTSGAADGRTSTAATSIASQPGASWYASSNSGFGSKPSPVTTPGVERPNKGKRMYNQGLDQQMIEQQSSALNRLNSVQRNGINGANSMGLSRSTSNLHERFQKQGFFANNGRSNSPSPAVPSAGLSGFDFSANSNQPSRSGSREGDTIIRETPPMSPMADPTLAAAINANDLGKATATGAFNKPKSPYNEQQYAQRQKQLQEGRETPPNRSYSRQDSATDLGRTRNGSMASVYSANSSKNQYRTNQGSRAPSNASNHQARASPVNNYSTANGTYFADGSGSETSSHPNSPEREPASSARRPNYQKQPSSENIARSKVYEHDDQHPAFRNQPDRMYIESNDSDDDRFPSNPYTSDTRSHTPRQPDGGLNAQGNDAPQHLGGGLSDMVKGHLRNYSNASSVYPDSPGMDQENADDASWGKSNVPGRPSFESAAPAPLGINGQRQVLQQANQLANANSKAHDVLGSVHADKPSQVLGPEVPRRSNESSRGPWQEQLKGHHVRGASTETQKEREDFANELADRAKAVQEKLKNFAEDGNKIGSKDASPAKPGGGSFGGLLKKSSRGSLAKGGGGDESKAARMLGMGSSNNSTTDVRVGRSEVNGKAGAGEGPSFRERSVGAERRDKFFRKANPAQDTIQRFNNPDAAPPPPPAPFGFQRSRTDPANQPMSFHPAGRARQYSPPRPKTIAPTVAPNVEIPVPESNSRASSAMGNRSATSTKSPGSYFPPAAVGSSGLPAAPPLPQNPQSIGFPSLGNPRPTPGPPAFSANSTPPLELPPHLLQGTGATSPSMVSPPVNGAAAVPSTSRHPGARKRSVSKHEISEPKFVSGTSSVITVDLPAGASLANGMSEFDRNAPPLPPINPRRRWAKGEKERDGNGGASGQATPTQNLFTAFGGKSPNMPPAYAGTSGNGMTSPPMTAGLVEEKSTWDGDGDRDREHRRSPDESRDTGRKSSGGGKERRERTRLRKTSSAGDGVGANKARHQALMRGDDGVGVR